MYGFHMSFLYFNIYDNRIEQQYKIGLETPITEVSLYGHMATTGSNKYVVYF